MLTSFGNYRKSSSAYAAHVSVNAIGNSISGSLQPRRGVMSRLFWILHRRQRVISLCVGLLLSATAWSQQPAAYSRSTAIDQKDSRAEHEAEQLVSLSADRILFILRDEPGLLLQIKKALVRKAFEQGRILDPNDLTDDALFTLIRKDRQHPCHRDTGDRGSFLHQGQTHARRTRARLAVPTADANRHRGPRRQATRSVIINHEHEATPSQEEEYWRKHENDLDCYLTQYLPYGTSLPYGQAQYNQAPSPATIPSRRSIRANSNIRSSATLPNSIPSNRIPNNRIPPSQVPQQGPSTDYRRQLELTQTQPSQGYFGMDSDQSEMASIQPDELPSLLSASQTGGLGSGMSKQGAGNEWCRRFRVVDVARLKLVARFFVGFLFRFVDWLLAGRPERSLWISSAGTSLRTRRDFRCNSTHFPNRRSSRCCVIGRTPMRMCPRSTICTPSTRGVRPDSSASERMFSSMGRGTSTNFRWICRQGQTMSSAPATG